MKTRGGRPSATWSASWTQSREPPAAPPRHPGRSAPPSGDGDGDDAGDGDKGDKSYGGKRGEVWIFGGCDESGVLDDVWRYDGTRARGTRRVARPGRRSAGRRGGRGGSKAAAAAGAEKKNVACPLVGSDTPSSSRPARELDPTAAARLHVADESPCAVIHGGCGAGGEVLNDV